MNKLLIHHQNSILVDEAVFSKEEQFYFDVDLEIMDVDFYIDEQLSSGFLKNKIQDADIVFVKVALSRNYLEYLGIRLAYHIRLTKSLGVKANIPIIFIAEESFQFLGLTSTTPGILLTQGIYLMKDTKEEFRKFSGLIDIGEIKPLVDRSSFIDRIQIAPPASYKSHHSVANEWSLLKWAAVLGIADSLEEVKQNISRLLYYKFLRLKYPIERDSDKARWHIAGRGKILFIDDEWKKGWGIVLREFFRFSPPLSSQFSVFEFDFKDKNSQEIVRECGREIERFDPEIVILDLRLSDSDFGKGLDPSDMSGFHVLKEIKKINPGIQVIIFSATNKIWNFVELQNIGADGFVLKESPDLGIVGKSSNEDLKSLKRQIELSLENSFLKDVFRQKERIIDKLRHKADTPGGVSKGYVIGVENLLNDIYSSVEDKYNPRRFDAAFMYSFLLLEATSGEFIGEGRLIQRDDNNESVQYAFVFKRSGHLLMNFNEKEKKITEQELRSESKRISYNQKFLNLIYELTGDVGHTFNIVRKRNRFIHPDFVGGTDAGQIEQADFQSVYSLICKVLDAI